VTYKLLIIAIPLCAIILSIALGQAIRRNARKERRRRALESIADRNWTLPPDYKFDRDEANER
jgi:antitoxin MazE